MSSGLEHLSQRQRWLLREWLPDAEVVKDHSWGLVGTTVLQLEAADEACYIAKAGDENDHHIAREIAAHRQWLDPWTSLGRAPSLVAADEQSKLLLATYLPGDLVQGTAYEQLEETYRQAGSLLASFHGQLAVVDDGEYERRQKQGTLAWLGRPHRIDPDITALLTELVADWPTPPSVVVPTHGDWQPRNWLIHDDRVSVIDFGRAALRPASTDFGRLAAQQFRTDPRFERAFFEGYGNDLRDLRDLREDAAWLRLRICDAVGTAAWAYKVGDQSFEQQGHRMIAEVIADLRACP